MRKDTDIQSMRKDVTEQLGPIDVLANNAGSLLAGRRSIRCGERRTDHIHQITG